MNCGCVPRRLDGFHCRSSRQYFMPGMRIGSLYAQWPAGKDRGILVIGGMVDNDAG